MEGDAECIIQERNKKNKTKYIHHRGLNSMHAKSPPLNHSIHSINGARILQGRHQSCKKGSVYYSESHQT